MRGERTKSATAGAILLSETLSRLNVPFGLYGFQDLIIPLVPFGQQFDHRGKRAISEIRLEVSGDRPEGNNNPIYNDDAPCIREVSELLLEQDSTDRLLIVVSDGLPEGSRSDADDLRALIEELTQDPRLDLIALGLGANTSHVESFYPEGRANIPLELFASEIGDLIQQALMH